MTLPGIYIRYLLLCNKLLPNLESSNPNTYYLTVFVGQESGHGLTEFSSSGCFTSL